MRFSAGVFLYSIIIIVGPAVTQRNTADPGYNCTHDRPCWPTERDWADLNTTVDGNLQATVPLAAPCYFSDEHYNAGQCKNVQDDYSNSTVRSSVYGASEILNWESCGKNGCVLQSILPQIPPFLQTCSLGRLASYFVDARSADEISQAIQFAKTYNLRLSIKNSGHDYFGRHMAPNTLAIWTHNLNHIAYHSSFVAHNCPSANSDNIGEMGAGVQASAAYEFFGQYDMDVAGGNAGTVGLAGGYGQGGGHGVFGPSHGLMVDNAVEFDVVTADGTKRTINECNEPDLFWAMRGGGGGTYSVLTSYKFRLFPSVPISVYTFLAKFPVITHPNALQDILTAHANNQTAWSNHNVSGHAYYYPGKMELYLVLPYNDGGSRLKELTSEFRKYITGYPGIKITQDHYHTYPKYTEYMALSQSVADRLTPAGLYEVIAGRLVPRSLFTLQNVSSLVNAVVSGVKQNQNIINYVANVPTQIIMTTPANHPDRQTTGLNPAWRGALWHVVYAGGWTKGIPTSVQRWITRTLLKSLDPLKKLTPGGGCYMNEGHYLEPDWQQTFFGSNYNRLLSVKNRYDPTHLFDCWKCVGWRGESDPFYSCYS